MIVQLKGERAETQFGLWLPLQRIAQKKILRQALRAIRRRPAVERTSDVDGVAPNGNRDALGTSVLVLEADGIDGFSSDDSVTDLKLLVAIL